MFQMSIRDNIRLNIENASNQEIENACKLAGAYGFINDMEKGFDTELNENCTNISGGQKQRIALARAILRDSRIIIVDEGTKALDAETEEKIIDNLKALSKERVIIVISHREAIFDKADKIYYM